MENEKRQQNRNRKNLQRFFVTDDELKQIFSRMETTGIENKSAYYRQMALYGAVVHWDFDGLHQLIYEINKIGQNINQLAKHANVYNDIPIYLLDEISSKLDKVVNHYCNNIPRTAGGLERKNLEANHP